MNKLSIKGIILGALAVFVIDVISGIAMIPIFAESMSEESLMLLQTETGPLLYSLFLGTISTIIGGYIAARYAKEALYLNAGIIGLFGIVIGLLINSEFPLWFNIIGYTTVVPAALIGGYFATTRKIKNV